jgi:hypothetical protein
VSLRRAPVLAALTTVAAALAFPASPIFAATRTCSSAQLRLSSVRILDAAGQRIWDLALNNTGRATCSLRGYPTVKLLNRRGQATVPAHHARGFTLRTVAISPGRRAFFSLSYASAGPCLPHYFTAYGLDVFPPGNHRGLRLDRPAFTLCSVALGGHPRVTPVRARLNES